MCYVDYHFILGYAHTAWQGAKDTNKVYLVDFGLAQKYMTYSGSHKEYQTQALEGTPDYASVFVHEGAST